MTSLAPNSGRTFAQLFAQLFVAASQGKASEVQALLLATPRLAKHKDSTRGQTPLMVAAENGHVRCVALLAPLSHVNARDPNGWTAIMSAAFQAQAQCVAVLAPDSAPSFLSSAFELARKVAPYREEGWLCMDLMLHHMRPEHQCAFLKQSESILAIAPAGTLPRFEALIEREALREAQPMTPPPSVGAPAPRRRARL